MHMRAQQRHQLAGGAGRQLQAGPQRTGAGGGDPQGLEGGVDYEFGLRAKRALTPQPSGLALVPGAAAGQAAGREAKPGGSGGAREAPPQPCPPSSLVAVVGAALAGAVAGAVAVGAALGRRA
jgi:hypothetical protein